MFALVDCNNFYVSCERVFNPAIVRSPVLVLSNNDGCCISRSDEAKQLGIKMGTPAFEIKELIAQHNIAIFSSNYTLYGDMSRRVIEILETFSPKIEVYSIDESFLDFSGILIEDLFAVGQQIVNKVRKSTGIPVSVGFGSTKTLAKLANRLAKKNKSTAICILNNNDKILAALEKTLIEDIWGIGKQNKNFLNKYGILTAMDYVNTNSDWIKKHLSVTGLRTQKELNGEPCMTIQILNPSKENIATTRSFGKMQTDFEPIAEAVSQFAAACCRKLRNQNSCAGQLIIFVHTNQFRADLPQYARNELINLPVPTNDSAELIRYARQALKRIFRKGYQYKKAGVIVGKIVPESEVCQDLFDSIDRSQRRKAMASLDSLNKRFGTEKIKLAAQGSGRHWKLRQENLSPCYTTNINDVLIINCR